MQKIQSSGVFKGKKKGKATICEREFELARGIEIPWERERGHSQVGGQRDFREKIATLA